MTGTTAGPIAHLAEFVAGLSPDAGGRVPVDRVLERARGCCAADAIGLIADGAMIAGDGDDALIGVDAVRFVAEAEGIITRLDAAGADVVGIALDGDGEHVLFARRSEFTPEERELLPAIAHIVRIGMRMPDRRMLLEGLGAIQQAISRNRPLHEVLDEILAAATKLLAAPAGVVRVRSKTHGEPVIMASAGFGAQYLTQTRRRSAHGISGQALAEDRVVAIDARRPADPPPEWREPGYVTGIAAPAHDDAEPIGALMVATRDPHRIFSERDEQTLRALADYIGLAFSHATALDDLVHGSLHDALTGLPNRTLFLDRISHALTRAGPRGAEVTILLADIDDFKTINDSLGHAAGDMLLADVAQRFAATVEPGDTVARLGGDEFGVLVESESDPKLVADRLMAALREPLERAGRQLTVSASIGIATGATDPETLLRDADLAMFHAKDEGKGRHETFKKRLHAETLQRFELEADLERAIAEDELRLHYQPIYRLRTGELVGLESLVRWVHPADGLLKPGDFIPHAERGGQIHELGEWVLGKAATQAAEWHERFPLVTLRVGVNVSAAQLRKPDFVRAVQTAVGGIDLGDGNIVLEVTETAVIDDLSIVIRQLRELTDFGLEIALDDFGVGQSSLRYLQDLPLHYLKIAKPFVDEIDAPNPKPSILRAILDLADVFGLAPIAEGVERASQAQRLAELGCEAAQGWHLGRPAPAAEIEVALESAERRAQAAELR